MRYTFAFLLMLAFLTNSWNCASQNERNFWFFGQGAGLDFSSGTPVSIGDNVHVRRVVLGQVEGPDHLAVVSSSSGDLQFYSDGNHFYNSAHQPMPSSPTLVFSDRQAQMAVIRHPGNEDQYIVFIIKRRELSRDLVYSIVDMRLDNGRGDLVPGFIDVTVTSGASQHLTTARHYNGVDRWIIFQNRNQFATLLVGQQGVTSRMVKSEFIYRVPQGGSNKIGFMAYSNPKALLAVGYPGDRVLYILKLNPLTGVLDLIKETQVDLSEATLNLYKSGAFSRSGDYFYTLGQNCGPLQYPTEDFFTPLVPADSTFLDTRPLLPRSFDELRRGPDNKIYVMESYTNYLGAINDTEVLGLGSNFVPRQVALNFGSNMLDLPTFVMPKNPQGISFRNVCLGEETQFNINPENVSQNHIWDFGDGSPAFAGREARHTYTQPGNYQVSVSYDDDVINQRVTEMIDVIIFDQVDIPSPQDVTNCVGGREIFFADTTLEILDGIAGSNAFQVSYFLNEEDAQLINNPITSYQGDQGSQTVYVRIANRENESCFNIASFEVLSEPSAFIDQETFLEFNLCESGALDLLGPPDYDRYEWFDGTANRDIRVDAPGSYLLRAYRDLDAYTCEVAITYSVDPYETPDDIELNLSDGINTANSLEVLFENSSDFEFSIDGVNYQDLNQFSDLEELEYTLYIRDKRCGTVLTREVYFLDFPKFFTPNNDGFNDTWQIANSEKEAGIITSIYDRYGKLLTRLDLNKRHWDGTYNGQPLPSSDYWFVTERPNGKVYRGHFTLKR